MEAIDLTQPNEIDLTQPNEIDLTWPNEIDLTEEERPTKKARVDPLQHGDKVDLSKSIDDLPSELMQKVFNHLPLTQRTARSKACKNTKVTWSL